MGFVEIRRDDGVRSRVIVAGDWPDWGRGLLLVGEALGQPLPVRHVDLEPLPVPALVTVVVGREEVVQALLHQRDCDGDRVCLRVGGVRGRPLGRVVVHRVLVVAELVGSEVVGLDDRVVRVGVKNCRFSEEIRMLVTDVQ